MLIGVQLGIFILLSKLVKRIPDQAQAAIIEFYTIIDGVKRKVENMFLKVSQNLPLSIEIKDKFGNVAKVDGAPVWSLTNPILGILEVSEDGMSAVLKPVGGVGSLKVQVNADADLGEGIKSILGELDVDMLAGEAVSVAISAGEPVDQ